MRCCACVARLVAPVCITHCATAQAQVQISPCPPTFSTARNTRKQSSKVETRKFKLCLLLLNFASKLKSLHSTQSCNLYLYVSKFISLFLLHVELDMKNNALIPYFISLGFWREYKTRTIRTSSDNYIGIFHFNNVRHTALAMLWRTVFLHWFALVCFTNYLPCFIPVTVH